MLIIRFCPICGTRVDRENLNFCPECGAELRLPAAEPPAAAQAGPPAPFEVRAEPAPAPAPARRPRKKGSHAGLKVFGIILIVIIVSATISMGVFYALLESQDYNGTSTLAFDASVQTLNIDLNTDWLDLEIEFVDNNTLNGNLFDINYSYRVYYFGPFLPTVTENVTNTSVVNNEQNVSVVLTSGMNPLLAAAESWQFWNRVQPSRMRINRDLNVSVSLNIVNQAGSVSLNVTEADLKSVAIATNFGSITVTSINSTHNGSLSCTNNFGSNTLTMQNTLVNGTLTLLGDAGSITATTTNVSIKNVNMLTDFGSITWTIKDLKCNQSNIAVTTSFGSITVSYQQYTDLSGNITSFDLTTALGSITFNLLLNQTFHNATIDATNSLGSINLFPLTGFSLGLDNPSHKTMQTNYGATPSNIDITLLSSLGSITCTGNSAV